MGERDNLIRVFISMYMHLVRWRGAGRGAMFWQLMAEGMSSYGDGYEIVLCQNPSTTALVLGQSHNLVELTHLFTMMYEYTNRRQLGVTC